MATTRTPEEVQSIHNRLKQKTEERKKNLEETGFAATNEELAAGEQSGIPLGYIPPSEGVQRISQPDTFIRDESDGQGGRVVTTEVKPSESLNPIMVQKPEAGRAVSLVGDESSNSSKTASSSDTTTLKDTAAVAVRDVATGQEVLLNRSSPPKDNLNVRNVALDGLKNKTGDNSSSQPDAEKVSSRDAQTASATDESKDLADSGENIIGLSARDDKKKNERASENVDSFRVTNNDGQTYSSLSKDSPINQSVQGVTSIPSVVTKYTDRDQPSLSTVNANDPRAFSSNTATIETPKAKDQLPAGDFQMVAGEKVTQGQPLSQEQQAALQIKNEMSGDTQNTPYALTDDEKNMSDEEFDRLYPDFFAMANEPHARAGAAPDGPGWRDGKFPHEIEQSTSSIQNNLNDRSSNIETANNTGSQINTNVFESNNRIDDRIENSNLQSNTEKDALPVGDYKMIAGEQVMPGKPLTQEQQAAQQIKDEMSGSSINETNNIDNNKFNANNVIPDFNVESFLSENTNQTMMNNSFADNESSSSFDFNSDGSMNYESQLELLTSIQQSTEFRNGVTLDRASINSKSYMKKQRIIQMGGGSSSYSSGAPQTFKPTDSWDPTNVPNPNPNLSSLASQLFI